MCIRDVQEQYQKVAEEPKELLFEQKQV